MPKSTKRTRAETRMAEARAATADGDAVRAHNLALKARLLSNELAR